MEVATFSGYSFFMSGVDGHLIQSCMHHRSPEAHVVYTRLTPSEINALLNEASQGRSYSRILRRYALGFHVSAASPVESRRQIKFCARRPSPDP